ncbi:MAG: hypothetical protein HC817_06350 [Saprospiraceae bacterium]|nr:hypothetical protein [Saprospiraceae bacterium]
MLKYSGFNMFVSMSGFLAQRIDQVLIAGVLGFSKTPVFNLGFFISEAIDVPRKALSGISAPLIAQSIRENNIAHVSEIYRKSALLQLIIGTFLLAATWACTDALFDLMPKNGDVYRQGKNVILLLGLSRLIDMATGTNAEIITYSAHYRFNLYSLLSMAILNIALNFLLLKPLGITGSALATFFSITFVNIWRLLFIKQKMGIHPLSISMLWVLILGIFAWFFASFIPKLPHPSLTIIAKGITVTLIFFTGILYFKISDDLNSMAKKLIINAAIGYCHGNNLPCRPKLNHVGVMFWNGNEHWWTHLTNLEFIHIFVEK